MVCTSGLHRRLFTSGSVRALKTDELTLRKKGWTHYDRLFCDPPETQDCISQILHISVKLHDDKTPPKELLTNQDNQDVKELSCIQLKINYI